MKKFFTDMFSSSDSVSSKRVIAVSAFLVIAAAAITDIYTSPKKTLSEFIFWGIMGLITACLGMNTITNLKSMDVKSDTASGILKEKPSGENAKDVKDVLNSENPK